MSKRVDIEKWVSKFTNPTIMKFQPVEDLEEPEQQTKTGMFTRIRNYFSPPKQEQKGGLKRTNSITEAMMSSGASKKGKDGKSKPKIKFVKRLTNDHVLVGNQDQIDAMSISGLVNQFVDTEFLWSLKLKQAIVQVAIDYKKSQIIILSQSAISVFPFDHKAIHVKPQLLTSVSLVRDVKFLNVLREGIFSLCYEDCIEIYNVDEVKALIRMILRKKYELPEGRFKLFQIPDPYDNILNIFFEEELQQSASSSFPLWNIAVEFHEKEVKLAKASKIYEVPKYLRPFARLQNYSKSIFLINLGKDIYAMRKGYVIDVASVNIMAGNNYLRYLSNNKLVHVTDRKVEVYNFSIDQNQHPPRIIVESNDSIQIPIFSDKYEYVNTVEIMGDNFAVFYQLKPSENNLVRGETKYIFIITHWIKMEEKLKNILPSDVAKVDISNLEERADMAKKMGMERKEIYLRLWNSSNKSDVEDFKLLLDTLDYDAIKVQIQKKLKKTSMNFREIYLLEQGCMSMLATNVFGPSCTKEDIKNYLISHTLIRKLQLYKYLIIEDKNQGKAVTEDPTGKLLINIQNYNYFKTIDIKSLLYEMIGRFCNQDKDQIVKIRIVLKLFKFALRIEYQEIIAQIIANTKKKFLKLLEAIPELLPYKPPADSTIQDITLTSGVWGTINDQQWERHLFVDTVSTIDNKENLKQIAQSVWYKRYWLTQHDYIDMTKGEILNIHTLNSSYQTFYLVIQKLFEHIKEYQPVRDIVDFIQDTYDTMPQHIYGKIFLYRKLFDHFKENRSIKQLQELQNFSLFLKLKDEDLFKTMFNFEKVKKGFILKEIKPLYQKLSCVEVFNQGLLNYFASDKSEISDIKYILNRLNNQKREFHEENKGIYEVLVRGMQLKLKLGSEKDIPIDEVLIYIENIPISHQTSIRSDLLLIQRINQYSQRFKNIKLNMTIFAMTKNMDNVIAALIHEDIQKTKVLQIRDIDQLKKQTYFIIEDVETIKEMIYPSQGHHQLTLFTYLVELLQKQDLIPAVGILLVDEELNKRFHITHTLIQNFVIYNYKWKMVNSPAYKDSQSYLKDLISLLPPENSLRELIQAELTFSEMLTSPELTVFYPLSGSNDYFTSRELQSLIAQETGEKLLEINIESLYQCALKIQELSSDNTLSQITLHGVYEMVIYRLIDCHMLKAAIPKIKTLIELQGDSPYNFIYPSLLVGKIAPEMIEQNRNLLLKCSTHLFKEPMKLILLLQEVMNIEATSSQYKELILKYYLEVKFVTYSYSEQSFIIHPGVLRLLQTQELKRNLIPLLRYSLYNILGHKEQFSSQPQFYIMFIILVNDPYVLIKYLYQNRYKINIKLFRCFLSYLVKENIFHKVYVMEFGKRLFYVIYDAVSNNKSLEDVIEDMRKRSIDDSLELIKVHTPKNQYETKLIMSIERMRQKLKTVKSQLIKRNARGSYNEAARFEQIRLRLMNPRSREGTYEYPFIDSDDTTRSEDMLKREDKLKPTKLHDFDSKFERQSLINRGTSNLALFLSIQRQKKQRKIYYNKKFTQDAIGGSLTIEKSFQKQIQQAIAKSLDVFWCQQQRDELTSPRRKLRLAKIESTNQSFAKIKEEMRKSRSRAINQITTEERLVIEKEEEEVLTTPVVSIVGNVVEEASVLVKILTPDMLVNEDTKFKFEELDPFRASQRFSLLLRELIQMAYNNVAINFKSVLIFIKRLNENFAETKINKEWIQIYLRAEALQNKFKLDLPLRNIFTVDGLFLESEISETLFHTILPPIIRNVNDENILKVCKVVNLAFKKTELEQQILYYYLLELLRIYQQSLEAIDTTEQDLKMQKEKFKMIIHKIPTKYLFEKENELIKFFRDENHRKEIVNIFIESFRNRYDMKSADAMYDKYIVKVKRTKRN